MANWVPLQRIFVFLQIGESLAPIPIANQTMRNCSYSQYQIPHVTAYNAGRHWAICVRLASLLPLLNNSEWKCHESLRWVWKDEIWTGQIVVIIAAHMKPS